MLDFIYNARSGGGKGKRAMETIAAELNRIGVKFRNFVTKAQKHAIELAKKLTREGATDIIAVGGDGTINEVLNGIDPQNVRFGIIPAGTGNDFVRSANIPESPLKALDVILHGEAKPTDYMDCSGVRGINVIGTGIDVDILERCERSKILKGKLQYVASLIISLIKFKFYGFDVLLNGERTSKEALIIAVGNGKMFGGGIRICPEAEIDDGLMDFVVCNRMKKSRIPSAFMKLMKGKILEQPFTEFQRVEEVEACFDKKITVNVDGELYEGLPFAVKLVKGGVKLYRP